MVGVLDSSRTAGGTLSTLLGGRAPHLLLASFASSVLQMAE